MDPNWWLDASSPKLASSMIGWGLGLFFCTAMGGLLIFAMVYW